MALGAQAVGVNGPVEGLAVDAEYAFVVVVLRFHGVFQIVCKLLINFYQNKINMHNCNILIR